MYKLYHYQCDSINDVGWGCVYRNIQTIFSALNYYKYINYSVPSITELLKCYKLYELYRNKQYSNTQLWIEPYHASIYIKKNIPDINCVNLLYLRNKNSYNNILKTPLSTYGSKQIYTIYNKQSLEKRLINLNKNNIPILIDNGIYSYLITNLRYANNVLICDLIDPHKLSTTNVLRNNFLFNILNYDTLMIMAII